MRPLVRTLLLLTLAGGTVHADVPASPRAGRPSPPSTTFRTSVRVLPSTAAAPARISIRIPRERLQALLARASRDGAGVGSMTATIDDGAQEQGGASGGTLRSVVTALALALAVLALPLLGRRTRTGAVLGLVMLAAGWTAHAEIAPPRLTVPPPHATAAPPSQAPHGITEPATALLELTVTDDGSSAVLLMHATAR